MSDLDDEFFALLGGGGDGDGASKSTKRKSTSSKSGKSSSSKQSKKQKKSTSSKVITPAIVEDEESAGSDMEMSAGSDDDNPPQATTSSNTNNNARRGRPSNSSKQTKYDEDSDADAYGEEDDDNEGDEGEDRNEFPLEGKYINSKDKAEIKAMSEFDREQILGERADKILADQSRKDLRKMVKAKERADGGGELREGTRTTDRNRKATGATDIKASTLAKMKKQRETRGKKKEKNSGSSPQRRRDDSSEEYEDNDRNKANSDSEEGEVSDSYDNDHGTMSTRNNKSSAKKESSSKKEKSSQDLTLEDLKGCIVTREKIAAFLNAPWFADWIKGSFVRYLVGKRDNGEAVYRLSNIVAIRESQRQPYQLEGTKTTIEFKLQLGKDPAWFGLEGASNSPPTAREMNRTVQEALAAGLKLPSIKALTEIRKNLASKKEYVMSEADLSAHLAKKGLNQVNPFQSKAKLLIQRDFARSTGDAQLLLESEAALRKLAPVPTANSIARETESERMSKVNERNRKKDREEIKKYEAKSMEDRRKLAESLRKGEAVKVDASARVKTMTRLTYDRATDSRPTTPGPGTPTNGIASPAVNALPSTPAPVADERRKSAFEKMVTDLVDVDVDLDF